MIAIITPIIQNNNNVSMKKMSNSIKRQVQRQRGIKIDGSTNNISIPKRALFLKSLWSYLYLYNE